MSHVVPVLRGPRVLLRPVEPADQARRQALGLHPELARGYGIDVPAARPLTDAEAAQWYDDMTDPSAPAWVVVCDGVMVGQVLLRDVRAKDAKARYSIALLDPAYVGRGLGTEATRLVLTHAFGAMGLHRVHLKVFAFNERAVACYRKCGFVVEGVEREAARVGGEWCDDVIMGVLDREFARR